MIVQYALLDGLLLVRAFMDTERGRVSKMNQWLLSPICILVFLRLFSAWGSAPADRTAGPQAVVLEAEFEPVNYCSAR
jgi:cytochrome c oxidase subunit IV